MSISIIQDPLDPSSVKKFENVINLLDPRLNTLPLEGLTWRGWFNILKSLYTRENLANNPQLFNSYLSSHDIKAIKKIWSLVSDEDLWMLAYTTYAGGFDNRPYLYFYEVTRSGVDDYGRKRILMIDRFVESHVSYDTDSFKDFFNEYFSIVKDSLLSHMVTECLDKVVSPSGNFGPNQLTDILGKMLTKQSYISEVNSGHLISAEKFLRQCSQCSQVIELVNGYGPGNPSNFLPQFQIKVSKTWRDPLYKVMSYSTNPLSVLPYPLISKGEHSPPLFGVELEVSTDYNVRTIIDAGHEPFMLAKQDSSVSGRKKNPMELVTIPMSMKAHKKEWAHWFNKLDYLEFDCTTETSNGMHVHIDRTAFSNKAHINSLCWFVTCPANKEFMLLLSERTASSMAQWSPSPAYPSSRSGLKNYRLAYDYCKTIRGAVNLGKSATVEIRIFRGIVSYASVLKNLEAVDAMFQFTHNRSFSQLTLRHFINWLKQQPSNKYQVLKKFLTINNIDNVLYLSDIKQVIGNLTDPEQIVLKINQSGLPITSKLATYLNKGKKRTFVIDKATGLLVCVVQNKGKVSFLDRELEARYLRGIQTAA